MSLPEIILIAAGLSMDAFAVSIILGLSAEKIRAREYLIPGIFFGFFQALMPFIGYSAGIYFVDKIQAFDHWIAFALLSLIGGKMIRESFSKDPAKINRDSFNPAKMLVLALATSIDALAVGVTFAFFSINIFITIIITGFITFCVSIGGVKAGRIFGVKFKSKAELFGGAVLVALGLKILIEHLFF